MNRSTLLSTLFLLVLAAGSFWLIRHHLYRQEQNNKVLASAYAINAKQTTTNQKGIVVSELLAKKVEQFDSRQLTLLTDPDYRYNSQGQALWEVSADHGTIFHQENNLVVLKGHVIAKRFPNDKLEPLAISTSTLTIDPNKKMATTQAKVTIRQNENVITGMGMRANLKTGAIQLLSHIDSTIVPKQHPHQDSSNKSRT